MDRRIFLSALFTGILAAGAVHAQGGPGMGRGMSDADREKMREQMRKHWDDMDSTTRERAMDRMRSRRHEPKYEDMRERWDKMSPDARRRMMEDHHGPDNEKRGMMR
ncbi:MAG: hypothetical protein GC202_12330 [Alphaproteobacteria bacterium]|nr:hypothetical protein [Alphaproteobacteria bacterium]